MDYEKAREMLDKPLDRKKIAMMRKEFAYAYKKYKKQCVRTLLTIARYLKHEHPELSISIDYDDNVERTTSYSHTHIYATRGGSRTYSGFELTVSSPEGCPSLRINHDTTGTYSSHNVDMDVYYEIGKYEHEKGVKTK